MLKILKNIKQIVECATSFHKNLIMMQKFSTQHLALVFLAFYEVAFQIVIYAFIAVFGNPAKETSGATTKCNAADKRIHWNLQA